MSAWFWFLTGFAFLFVITHRRGRGLGAVLALAYLTVGGFEVWKLATVEAYSPPGERVALMPSWAGTCYFTAGTETRGAVLGEQDGFYYLAAGPESAAECQCLDMRELVPWR